MHVNEVKIYYAFMRYHTMNQPDIFGANVRFGLLIDDGNND